MLIVVMGVSGSGKTTVARACASRLGAEMVDADDVHTAAAHREMAQGVPITPAERDEWMQRVVERVRDGGSVVLACSALLERHRDLLRAVSDVHVFLLDVPRGELESRLADRRGHFFDPRLLDDQLATFERPGPTEAVTVLDGTLSPDALVERILSAV